MFVEHIGNGLDLSGTAKSISAIFETSLEPGQEIHPHYHEDLEEIYYILLGVGQITIENEQNEVLRGDVIYIPPLALHSLHNISNIPLRFVTVTAGISSERKTYNAQI